jgi:hypothetical protein
MDMRKRKLYQRLSYSDVAKAGTAFERARAQHPGRHPKVAMAGKSFQRKFADFQKIAAPGESAGRFLENRTKRRAQFGGFRKKGGFGGTSPRRNSIMAPKQRPAFGLPKKQVSSMARPSPVFNVLKRRRDQAKYHLKPFGRR